MPRIRYKLQISLSSTSAEEKDLGNGAFEVIEDGIGEVGAWKTTLAGLSSDVQIPLNNIATGRLLIIRTTSKDPTLDCPSITIKRNSSGGEALPIVPLATTKPKEGLFLMTTTGLTALYASNPASNTVEITIFAAGD